MKDTNYTPTRENRFVGTNWDEPEVHVRFKGTASTLSRKVKATGVADLDLGEKYDEIVMLLRQGKEVRLNGGIRLYALVSPDCKRMYVAASTMGNFREQTLSDKKVKVMHCGEVVNGAAMAACQLATHENENKRDIDAVTPDTIVTCPKCGHRFRVGRKI